MTFCKREIAFTNRRVGATGYNLMRNSAKMKLLSELQKMLIHTCVVVRCT